MSKVIELGRIFQAKYGSTEFYQFVPKYQAGDLLKAKDIDMYGIFIKYDYLRGQRDKEPVPIMLWVEKDYTENDFYYSNQPLYTGGGFGGPAYMPYPASKLEKDFEVIGHKGDYNLMIGSDLVSKKQ